MSARQAQRPGQTLLHPTQIPIRGKDNERHITCNSGATQPGRPAQAADGRPTIGYQQTVSSSGSVFVRAVYLLILRSYQYRLCRADDGGGPRPQRHHVRPRHHAVLRHLRDFRHSQQHYAEHCWRAALDCHHYGAVGYRLHRHHVRRRAEKPLRAAHAGGNHRSRIPAGDSAVLNLLVPGVFPCPRQRPVYDCHAGNHRAGLDCLGLYSVDGRSAEYARLAVAVPAGRIPGGAARRDGLVLARRLPGEGQMADRRG